MTNTGGDGGGDGDKRGRRRSYGHTPPKYQVFFDNDAFFVWAFVKRRPLWQRLLTVFLTSFIATLCFIPVYPDHVKLSILYFCASALLLILCLLLLRAFVFGALWIILEKHVWFFPDILAKEVTVKEAFQFLPKKDENERPKWTSRLFYAVVAIHVILLVRHNAPHRARYQEQVLYPT